MLGMIDNESKLQPLLDFDKRFDKRKNEFLSGSSKTNENIKVEPGVNLTFLDIQNKNVQKSGGDFCLSPKMIYKNVAKEKFMRPTRKLEVTDSHSCNEMKEIMINSSRHQRLLSQKTQASRNSCQLSFDKI